jgi:glucokinase
MPSASPASFDSPRLLADIGGTYARFVLEVSPGRFEHAASLRCADHPDFHAAVTSYLASLPPGHIEHAAVAIANPVEGDEVRMTNYHWRFSIEEMRQRLRLATLVVVNDFTALAMALPRLAANQRVQVGGGIARTQSVVGVLGAGSGLGVSGLIPAGDGWVALGTEGGHTSFAPRNDTEVQILRYAQKRFATHVSFERVLSGPGLALIHEALCDRDGVQGGGLAAPEITRRALAAGDPRCRETLEVFCAVLGTAAANLAVTLGATGGIFIGGGIVPRLGEWFARSPFRARFEDKGRFSDYVRRIPTYVVTAEHATWIGASAILGAQLKALPTGPGSALLAQVQRSLPSLSPAEKRVADYVLAHPRALLNQPILEIAAAAQVSQPTVIRFCRSLGCEGLSDFKLRLASGLTGTIPVTHSQVRDDDSAVEIGAKVLGNTASAVLQLRDALNRESIEKAVALLLAARRIEIYALGYFGAMADDAQFKFLRLRLPARACTDSRLQTLTAEVLGEGDVVLALSPSGRKPELLQAVECARARGARIIAITASQSPLARKADVPLIVEHDEDVQTQVPMISRVLHLLVVDILAVGVAMRQGETPALASPPAPPSAAPTPGVVTASPLASLTAHSR